MNKPRQSIVSAIHQYVGQHAELMALMTGGIWTGEIPEGVSMPYAMIEGEDSAYEWTFEDVYLEHGRFSIVFFAVGADQLDQLLNTFEGQVNWEDLQFEGTDEAVSIFPTRRTIRSEFLRDPDGNQVFSGVIQYQASVWRA